jgi:hypothetical protein
VQVIGFGVVQQDLAGPFVIELEGFKGQELDEAQTKLRFAESVSCLRSLGTFRRPTLTESQGP